MQTAANGIFIFVIPIIYHMEAVDRSALTTIGKGVRNLLFSFVFFTRSRPGKWFNQTCDYFFENK